MGVRRILRGLIDRRPAGPDPEPVALAPGTVLRELSVAGVSLQLADHEGSVAVEVVAGEVGHGAYDFSDIDFRPGDVVVDVGAHVGIVSIHLAKRYPFLRIYAYEALPPVFAELQRNLARNHVTSVEAFNLAVTGDGRPLRLVAHLGSNTGGGTSSFSDLDLAGHDQFTVASVTLDQIFERHHIGRCALLKIDVEGAEYDILKVSTVLDRVDNLRGEFHENRHLLEQGHTMQGLADHCARFLPAERIRYTPCLMADL